MKNAISPKQCPASTFLQARHRAASQEAQFMLPTLQAQGRMGHNSLQLIEVCRLSHAGHQHRIVCTSKDLEETMWCSPDGHALVNPISAVACKCLYMGCPTECFPRAHVRATLRSYTTADLLTGKCGWVCPMHGAAARCLQSFQASCQSHAPPPGAQSSSLS